MKYAAVPALMLCYPSVPLRAVASPRLAPARAAADRPRARIGNARQQLHACTVAPAGTRAAYYCMRMSEVPDPRVALVGGVPELSAFI